MGYPEHPVVRPKKTFGTQGRLAIPLIHLFIIMGPCSILKQTFATVRRSFAGNNFFVLFEDFGGRTREAGAREKRARHLRVLFLYFLSTIFEGKIEGL